MKKSIIFLVLTFALVFSIPADASLYLTSNGKTFNINVTRSDFRPIYDARGSVFVNGNSARVEVRASGYRSSYKTIYLNDNTNYYNANISLNDPTIFADLIDSDYGSIQFGTLSYYSQSFYQTDEFGIKGRFPVAGFEKITSRDIDARINSLSAWMPRVYLYERGGNWEFEIVLKRRDFSDYSNRIKIVVKKSPAESAAPAQYIAMQVQDYLAISEELNDNRVAPKKVEVLTNRLASLAREITQSFPSLDEGQKTDILRNLSDAPQLKRELYSIQLFQNSHSF